MINYQFSPEEENIISGLKQGNYLEIQHEGINYQVNKNKWFYRNDDVYRFHKNSNVKVMENKKFNRPHISKLGFNTYDEWIDFLFSECESEIGLDEKIIRKELYKSNSSQILDKLSKIWSKNWDCDELYGNKFYMLETLHCGIHVTSQFQKSGYMSPNSCGEKLVRTLHQMGIQKRDEKGESFKILDLGSGLGITTLLLASYLPNSTIYYNEINPPTLKLFKKLVQKSGLTNIKMITHEEGEKIKDWDIIVGIEFFEHIQEKESMGNPMVLVDLYLQGLKDDGIFIMNTFWDDSSQDIPSLGHFEDYLFDGEVVNRLGKGRKSPQFMFNRCMENRGFKMLSNKFWDWRNHGPNTYIRKHIPYNNPPSEFFR